MSEASNDNEAELIRWARELAADIAAGNSAAGLSRVLSNGQRYVMMPYETYEHDLMARFERGKKATGAAIVAWLREAIGQGYPAINEDKGKCAHGTYHFEDCIGCYDEFLIGKLEAIDRGDHLSTVRVEKE